MRIITTKKRNATAYWAMAWIGRQLYHIRLKLEVLNDWVDLQAGIYLGEEED